ncbi:MAG: Mini-ribonuclease 3 [Candidatus Gastranaerophilaceae bacterium]
MIEIPLRNYAHIGDAVWELFVREYTVNKTQNSKLLHNMTTERVRASFQAELLNTISDELTESELDIARRARNISIPVARRSNQGEYRQATAFEALIGYWYLHDKLRLEKIFNLFKTMEQFI